jgi:hypothetical protein
MKFNRSLALAVMLTLMTYSGVQAASQTAAAGTTQTTEETTIPSAADKAMAGTNKNVASVKASSYVEGQPLPVEELRGVETVSGETKTLYDGYAAAQADQNALLLRNGANVTVSHSNLSKLGNSTSLKGSRLNGQNAVVDAVNSTASLEGCVLHAQANGAAAIFAAGSQANVTVHNSNIRTDGEWCPGLASAQEGKITANNVNVGTAGTHSAAVSAAGGKAAVTVTQSTLSTSGTDSPVVYSGGDVSVSEVRGGAGNSNIVVVEGRNVARLEYADFTGGGSEGVLLYRQLHTAPAADSYSRFSAKHSTLRHIGYGPMFYVTNTRARVYLEMTGLQYEGDVLAKVAGGEWGKQGENGASAEFIANQQPLSGTITVDNLSSAEVKLENESHWNGTINADKKAQRTAVSLDAKSTWSLTGDAYVTAFTDADTTLSNIKGNGHNIYYDRNDTANQWLGGCSIGLIGGGSILPMANA